MNKELNFMETDYKFTEHEAVIWNDQIARVEDRVVDINNKNICLIQTPSHRYHYVYEENLERYIG